MSIRLAMWACVLIAVLAIGTLAYRWAYGNGRESMRPEIERLTASILAANAQAKAQTDAAQNEIGRLQLDLAKQQAIIDADYGDTSVQIDVVTRPDRACLSPGAARVLRDAISRANARLAESISASQHPQTDAAPADTGIDERAIGRWTAAVISQYRTASARHATLAAQVERLPCVAVDETK